MAFNWPLQLIVLLLAVMPGLGLRLLVAVLELPELLRLLKNALLLLGDRPVVVIVVKMLVVSVVVSVAPMISTIATVLDSIALTVDVMKRVKVAIGGMMAAGVPVMFTTLQLTTVVVLKLPESILRLKYFGESPSSASMNWSRVE